MNALSYLVVIILGVLFYYIYRASFRPDKRYLLKNGIRSVAKVISIEKTLAQVGEGSFARPVMKIVLEIQFDGTSSRQKIIKQSFDFGSIPPMAGDNVDVLIDPKNPDNVMLAPSNSE